MSRQNLKLLVVIGVIFFVSALASYIFFGRSSSPSSSAPIVSTPTVSATPQGAGKTAQTQQSQEAENDSLFSELFNPGSGTESSTRNEKWTTVFFRVTLRLALAALFTAMLAFRPRKFSILFKRNLFVAQTQILLSVVASALMMIVGDSAARAFGIFAAVSLVRFRTNIKDPKEVTVLLVSLAVGLATGVGRWELAAILSLFVLLLLWGLEYRESEMLYRTMDLKVKTRNLVETHEVIRSILKNYGFGAELRTLNREDPKDPLGCVVFCVEVSPRVSTDELSAEILSADNNNIDTIEWTQQKSSNAYQ